MTSPAHKPAAVYRDLAFAALAMAWSASALSQGVVLEAPMQPIKKRVAPCAACADPAALAEGQDSMRGQDRHGPEFPAGQRDFEAGEGARGAAPLVDLTDVGGLGAREPGAASSVPTTIPAR